MTPDKRPGTIQSVTVAVRFLTILANAEAPLPFGEIVQLAGTGGSTAHRYLQSLVKEGLAQQDPASGRYTLGSLALNIGISALKRSEPIEIAADLAKGLSLERTVSCGVAVWTDRGPTLVRWYRSTSFSISSLGMGDILPIDNTACGLVFQAFLPPAPIEAARRLQQKHFRGARPDKAALEQVRGEGYAELTSHLLRDITGQAVPVFDAQGEIACALTTVTDLGRFPDPDARGALVDLAALANERTGGAAARQETQLPAKVLP